MGFLRSLLGAKIAGKMACFDIAKPPMRETALCTTMAVQYKNHIPEDNRRQAAINIGMMCRHYFMHPFNRMYLRLYGFKKLTMTQMHFSQLALSRPHK